MMIREFAKENIRMTWTLLSICFDSNNLLRNSEYEQKYVSASEVISYATDFLEASDDIDITSLAILKENEERDILKLLGQLSNREKCQYSYEFRKFRAMYIYKNLPKTNDDFMHGILKISELWDKFGFPEDSPNIYFKFEEYSLSNFKKLLDIHTAWIKNEFEIIRHCE